ncbi:MAG: esterase FrsA [Acidobacteriota bacterium]|nr:esterase FrsA [Acidobacteriota bacterium]
MFELKPLSLEAVPAALEKAHRYRLLNEPVEAESICRDILDVDSANQEALITLLLALTDQFDEHLGAAVERARAVLSRLSDEYLRLYHGGIICERRAKAHLKRGGPRSGHIAYEWLRQAMDHYEKAGALRPPGNDDAILRFNTCVRTLLAKPELTPDREERHQHWLE